jgi:hypothetical protein
MSCIFLSGVWKTFFLICKSYQPARASNVVILVGSPSWQQGFWKYLLSFSIERVQLQENLQDCKIFTERFIWFVNKRQGPILGKNSRDAWDSTILCAQIHEGNYLCVFRIWMEIYLPIWIEIYFPLIHDNGNSFDLHTSLDIALFNTNF